MQMSIEAFEMLTPAEFVYAYLGWQEHQLELQRYAWERARWHVGIGILSQTPKKDWVPISEMLPLPWEQSAYEITEEITDDERRARVAEMAKYINRE